MRKLVGCCVALAFSACGRTPFGDGATVGDGSADASIGPREDGGHDGNGDDEPDDDDPGSVFALDPDLPPIAETCGNGVIDTGELCFLPQIEFASRIDPCAIIAIDLDLDGHLDVAVPNSDFEFLESPSNVATVLRGDGTG